MDIFCKKTDTLKCTNCGLGSLVVNLRPVDGQLLKDPDSSCVTSYGYCPYCKDQYAMVFYRGDGSPPVLGVHAQVVESKQST